MIYREKKLLFVIISILAFSKDAYKLRRLNKVMSDQKQNITTVAQKPE